MKIDARGKPCPLPVIETKNALETASPGETVEVTVDNEITTQNLRKLAEQKKLNYECVKTKEREFLVKIKAASNGGDEPKKEEEVSSACFLARGVVAAISSDAMGSGDDMLGKILMKSLIYTFTKQDNPPETILLYNSGALISCEGSESLEDLKGLEARGAKIMTCGTCLNYYGLCDKLSVGSVTNMYEIADILTRAALVIRP